MTHSSTYKTWLLCRLKLRVIFNSFKNWASIGRLMAVSAGFFLVVFFFAIGSYDLLNELEMLPLMVHDAVNWIVGLILLYVIILVVIFDLITGHTFNTGQMSSDYSFLRTLPVQAYSILFLKLFERIAFDYIGFMTIFSCFAGLLLRDGLSVTAIVLSIFLYFQISLATGLTINLILIFMKRFFRISTINNLFSILSFSGVMLVFVPHALVNAFPERALYWLLHYETILNSDWLSFLLPFRWLANVLIEIEINQSFLYWNLSWSAFVALGITFYYFLLKLNWLDYSHSAGRRTKTADTKWLKGFYRKDYLLLKKDFNLLVNAIIMPIVIIAMQVFFFHKAFSFDSANSILNIIFASIVYFCLFGPVNCIGVEGKTISYIETLPVSPSSIITKKFLFWFSISLVVFLPASVAAFYYLGFQIAEVYFSLFHIILFCAAAVFSTVCISCIFARFDVRILQQHSTFGGKMAALGLMLVLTPIKSHSYTDIYNFVIFLLLTSIIYCKACRALFHRLSPRSYYKDSVSEVLFFGLFFLSIEIVLIRLFDTIAPGVNVGLWPWAFAAIAFMGASIIYTMHNQLLKKFGLSLKRQLLVEILLGAIAFLLFFLIAHNIRISESSNIKFFMHDLESLGISKNIGIVAIYFLFLFTMLSSDILYRAALLYNKSYLPIKIIVSTCITLLLFPTELFFAVLLCSIVNTLLILTGNGIGSMMSFTALSFLLIIYKSLFM